MQFQGSDLHFYFCHPTLFFFWKQIANSFKKSILFAELSVASHFSNPFKPITYSHRLSLFLHISPRTGHKFGSSCIEQSTSICLKVFLRVALKGFFPFLFTCWTHAHSLTLVIKTYLFSISRREQRCVRVYQQKRGKHLTVIIKRVGSQNELRLHRVHTHLSATKTAILNGPFRTMSYDSQNLCCIVEWLCRKAGVWKRSAKMASNQLPLFVPVHI